jgi:hypothetical protein
MSNNTKTKEQIERESEIAGYVTSREESGVCACNEICVSQFIGRKDARKSIKNDKEYKCKCECNCKTNPDIKCFCYNTCLDDKLGSTGSYVRELSKPPYTNWNGILTCPADSIYAERLTEFKPEVVKESDDKEKVAALKEKNAKKGVRFTHNGCGMIRGYWSSPEPEFWLGRLVC